MAAAVLRLWLIGTVEGEQIGIVAQKVERISLKLVMPMNERKFINYQELIPVHIEAVKDQQALISQLREDVRECVGR